MNQILLIGGQPKGFKEPFSRETHSGKVLHRILEKYQAEDHVYLADIWDTPEQEQNREFIPGIIESLWSIALNWYPPIALGKYQYEFLKPHLPDLRYLPHPASRSQAKLQELDTGIKHYLGI